MRFHHFFLYNGLETTFYEFFLFWIKNSIKFWAWIYYSFSMPQPHTLILLTKSTDTKRHFLADAWKSTRQIQCHWIRSSTTKLRVRTTWSRYDYKYTRGFSHIALLLKLHRQISVFVWIYFRLALVYISLNLEKLLL